MNNLRRVNSPAPMTPTVQTKPKRKSLLISPRTMMGKKKTGSIFTFGDDSDEDDELHEEESSEPTGHVKLNHAKESKFGLKSNQTLAGDETMQFSDKTLRMDETVSVEPPSVERTSKMDITSVLANIRLKRPVIQTEPAVKGPELTNDDIVKLRTEYREMEQAERSTPLTPTVTQGDLRPKLMKARNSLGIAKLKKTLVMRDDTLDKDESSLVMPTTRATPVTHNVAKLREQQAQMSILRNSPLTRNKSKRLEHLQDEATKTVNFSPAPKRQEDIVMTDEVLMEPVTPKRVVEEAKNDSILSLNLSISKSINLADTFGRSLDLDVDLDEITCDPATKLISPHMSMAKQSKTLLDMDDSFDYAKEMKSIRMEPMAPIKTPTPTPQDIVIDTKNEQYVRFLKEAETTLGQMIELDKLCSTEHALSTSHDNTLDKAVFNNMTLKESQMNRLFVKRLTTKITESQPTKYQLELLNNLSEKAVHALNLEQMEPRATLAAEVAFTKEILKMKKALVEPDSCLEQLVGQIRKVVPNEQALVTEVTALKTAHKSMNAEIDTLKRQVELKEATAQSVKQLKDDNKVKRELMDDLQGQIKKMEDAAKGKQHVHANH